MDTASVSSTSTSTEPAWARDPNTDISNIHTHPQIAVLNQVENKIISLLDFANKLVNVEENPSNDEMEQTVEAYLESVKDIKNDLVDTIRDVQHQMPNDYQVSDPWSLERKSLELYHRKMELMRQLDEEADREEYMEEQSRRNTTVDVSDHRPQRNVDLMTNDIMQEYAGNVDRVPPGDGTTEWDG